MDSKGDRHSGRPRIAVLGGGMAGLSAAFWLTELLPASSVTVFEAENRWGGLVRTVRAGGFLLECGPLAFPSAAPATSALLRAAGLTGLCRPCRDGGGLWVWNGRKAFPLPRTPLQLLRQCLTHPAEGIRLLFEPFIPRGDGSKDESVLDFFRRRTGLGFFRSAVEPVAAGVLAGDPARMSMAANLPRFLEMERAYGSLAMAMVRSHLGRGPRKAQGNAAPSTTDSGCAGFVNRLVDILTARGVRLLAGQAADGLVHETAHHVLSFRGGGQHLGQAFDAVISTLPARALSSLRIDLPVEILAFLTGIPRAPLSVQLLAFPDDAMGQSFQGSGMVAYPGAGERFLSCFLPTRMAPFACPAGFHLFRVAAGGARRPETALLDDGEFEALSIDAVRRMFAVRGEPVLSHRVLHTIGIAQIEAGHARRLGKTEAWLRENRSGFFLAGTGMAGAGVENAVASGHRAAQAASVFFHSSRAGTGTAGPGA